MECNLDARGKATRLVSGTLGVLFGIAISIAAILSLLEFIQKTLQNFSNFKFPIIGDFLARGYTINTDKSLIKGPS